MCGYAAPISDNAEGGQGEPMAGDPAKAKYIVISKESMTLVLFYSDDRVVCHFGVAVGRNYGNKQRSRWKSTRLNSSHPSSSRMPSSA